MENFLLLLIAILLLLFIWLMWARQILISHLRSFQRRDELLRRDYQKRRDMVPYLLESFRSNAEVGTKWHELLEARKRFHTEEALSLKEEESFEEKLNTFIQENDIYDINYLEAEKNILKMNETIDLARKEWKAEYDYFLSLKNSFPYSLASVIFKIRI